ncbi:MULTISPECIES: LysR family transcriptional regulator [Xanthomonas]|uniref:LysR family transcriptional regulator n=1 Tax=Xanthomonas TaxID=338 RepID=UPI0006E4D3C4|nr:MULTISPECIES: LysR family transcriptional regulator [Xanthomonas]MBO9792658.1 LysR family transcriptional regulator [Xanthomonas phaseoli pv. dieffenbachiae]MBO9850018.1 LysR family transcriptional regulator [Xanthomonas phaseoli pv. dieffenbachiae]OQP36513.1 LysR family transcriptional regulator [Xanthomonas euvesicatoria]
MRLTLRQLLIFTAVADTGSTTAAAERVALSQSATSGALNELESLLGAQLFDRIGKRLMLNDNGRALLPQARALLDGMQQIEGQFGLGSAAAAAAPLLTRLRVGASTTIGNYVLPSLIASYRSAWPGAAVDVVIGNTREVAAAVSRLEVDIGLIEGPCHEADLQVVPWRQDELVIVAAPTHALAQAAMQARVPLKALRQAHWLLREPGSGTREAVEQVLLPHLHHLHSDLQPGSTEAIKQAAAEGLGLACLSLCAVQDLVTLGRLVILQTTLPRLTRRFYRIQHRQKRLSGNLQRFVAHCDLHELRAC